MILRNILLNTEECVEFFSFSKNISFQLYRLSSKESKIYGFENIQNLLSMYDGRSKSSYPDQDTLMECDQMRFIFQPIPLVVHTLFPLVLHCLDPIGQKVINSRYNVMIWTFRRTLVSMCVIRCGTRPYA